MKLSKRETVESKTKGRKMIHIHDATHAKIQHLSIETGMPMNELVDLLLNDALSRVEIVEKESKE